MLSLSAFFLGSCLAGAPPVESADAYELALTTALPLLPGRVQDLVASRPDPFRRAAVSGQADGTTSKEWHYVQLDVAADAKADRNERLAAARAFPREREAAQALYASCGAVHGGVLPWIVEERFETLTKSFQAADLDRIVLDLGVLVHFAVDASLPFNATVQPRIARLDAPYPPVSFLRYGFHHEMVRRLRARLEFEMRVSPDRVVVPASARDAVFEVLVEAHRTALALRDLRSARQPADDLPWVDWSAESEVFVREMTAASAPMLETRIEEGALLAANLITAAWIKAGKPEWKIAVSTPTAVPALGMPDAPAGFVGSRNSTIYHRAMCSHVARIKNENRVSFDTPDKAHSAGRTPCQACKPDASAKP
jgi:hypothetical protein